MKKVLILTNSLNGLYSFRRELIEALVNDGYEVIISSPGSLKSSYFQKLGCRLIETAIGRRGTNPVADLHLLIKYIKIIKMVRPDIVLSYTIKPNVYGGIACKLLKTPYFATVTGLGTSIMNKGVLRRISLFLYKIGLGKASRVFFQNDANRKLFIEKRIIDRDKTRLTPGSGVNLDDHCFESYPEQDGKLSFLFIGRIMKDKGVDELLKAAQIVKSKHPNSEFHLVGEPEEDYERKLRFLEKKGVIYYHGYQENVHSFIKDCHAIINPSYHEGMSNVLLEAAATGRPVLASNVPGCKETFEEGITGLGFEARNIDSLVAAILKFIQLPYEEKERMGVAGRRKMEQEFDRNLVVRAYLEEIKEITGR